MILRLKIDEKEEELLVKSIIMDVRGKKNSLAIRKWIITGHYENYCQIVEV